MEDAGWVQDSHNHSIVYLLSIIQIEKISFVFIFSAVWFFKWALFRIFHLSKFYWPPIVILISVLSIPITMPSSSSVPTLLFMISILFILLQICELHGWIGIFFPIAIIILFVCLKIQVKVYLDITNNNNKRIWMGIWFTKIVFIYFVQIVIPYVHKIMCKKNLSFPSTDLL